MITKISNFLIILSFFYSLDSYSMNLTQAIASLEGVPAVNEKLKRAVIEGSLEKVQEALKEGADINFKFIVPNEKLSGYEHLLGTYPAIHHATQMGHIDIVKYLFKSGAYVEDNSPFSLLFVAIYNFDIFKFLIDSGMKININSYNGRSLGFLAIEAINLDAIKLLAYHGSDLNDKCLEHSLVDWAHIIPPDFISPECKREAKEVEKFVVKHAERMKNIKNKSLKDIAQKVNQCMRAKLNSLNLLINNLNDLVAGYYLYPESFEDFFTLSDRNINEMIKIYSEEFEKKEEDKKIKEEPKGSCLIM